MFILNPLLILTLTWLMVIFFYSLKWSSILILPTMDMFYFFICYIFIPFAISFIFVSLLPSSAKTFTREKVCIINVKRYKYLYVFFIVSTIFEIVVMKGFPLLWVFIGDPRGYVDYGIPSFHGLVNAVHLILISISFYKYITKNSSIILFLFLVFWSVCMLNRFIIMISVIQLLFLYISVKGVNFKKIIKITLMLFFVVLIFGMLGNLRSNMTNNYLYNFFGITKNYPSFLSPSFMWFYLYITTPFNNLVSWIDFNNFNYTFSSVYSGLVPSVIRDDIFTPILNKPELINDTFNMSTGYAPALIDMGVLGVFLFNVLIGGISTYCWILTRRGGFFFTYSVLLSCVFYLIFFNALFTLPIIFQVFILSFIINYEKRECHV